MESNVVRYYFCLLNMKYLRVFGSSPMLSSMIELREKILDGDYKALCRMLPLIVYMRFMDYLVKVDKDRVIA